MKIRVGIVGCGVVGTGVVALLLKNKEIIYKKTGIELVISKIADKDWTKEREIDIPQEYRTTDYREVIDSSDIVVELVGGKGFAKQLILEALSKSKAVVTANKHLLAEEGAEIFQLAKEKNLFLGFEASVGGGIPIIKALRESFVGNRIQNIYGILNGTTNFILTKMLEEDEEFEDALNEAKRLGYAEADPSLDIDGWDTAHKIAILAMIAYGKYFAFDQIYVEGIRNIQLLDVELGKELGYTLKLLAIAKRRDSKIEIRVHPTFLRSDNPLAKVSDVYNAIMIEGDFVGNIMLYGKGAGSHPTASAVVSDIVDAAKFIISNKFYTPFQWEQNLELEKNFYSRYYLRFNVPDRPGVLARIAGVLAEYNISIASVLQKEMVCQKAKAEGKPVIPLVLLTHKAYESDMRRALSQIETLPVVEGEPTLIRVEEQME